MNRNNLSKTDQIKINLNGQIAFYTEIARVASIVATAVPNHKTITSRIETAMNKALKDNTAYTVYESTDYDDAHKLPDGSRPTIEKRAYSSRVRLSKSPYSFEAGKFDLRIHANKPEYSMYTEDGISTNNSDDYTGRTVKEVSDIVPALAEMMLSAQKEVEKATAELSNLDSIEDEYNAIKRSIADFNAKYSYTARDQYKIQNLY